MSPGTRKIARELNEITLRMLDGKITLEEARRQRETVLDRI
jgi:hypothetical protein